MASAKSVSETIDFDMGEVSLPPVTFTVTEPACFVTVVAGVATMSVDLVAVAQPPRRKLAVTRQQARDWRMKFIR